MTQTESAPPRADGRAPGYSQMRAGQLVLGVVRTVNDFDMAVALANHMVGYVPCTRVSEAAGALFAAAAAGESPGGALPSMDAYYSVGEVVAAAVAARSEAGRRRIELSLRAQDVNAGLQRDALVPGAVVSGEVVSREDRGWTVSFGVPEVDAAVVGFLPETEVAPGTRLVPGKTATLLVLGAFEMGRRVAETGRVVTLSARPEAFADAVLSTRRLDVAALRPGALVSVREWTPGRHGMAHVPLARGVDAYVPLDDLPAAGRASLRVCHVDPVEKSCVLTARLADWRPPVARRAPGDRVEGAVLVSVVRDLGLVLALPADAPAASGSDSTRADAIGARGETLGDEPLGHPAKKAKAESGDAIGCGASRASAELPQDERVFVHVSRIADSRVESLDDGVAPFLVGSRHNVRLLEFDPFAGAYLGSTQPSVWREALLRLDDLAPGASVRGEVLRIEAYGLLVALTPRIRAVCPTAHLAEVAPRDEAAVRAAYHVGQKYRFRVLDVDARSRRVTLTRKKGLLDSPLSVLHDIAAQSPAPGSLHDGYVAATGPFGAIVRFFGAARGLLGVADISDEYLDRPQDTLFVGQVVRCRVLRCDPAAGTLGLSLRRNPGAPKTRRVVDAPPAVSAAAPLEAFVEH